jgi:hypothetical protein
MTVNIEKSRYARISQILLQFFVTHHLVFLKAESYALRSFMHIQESANAMAGPMVVVQPGSPQWDSRKAVDARSDGAFWKDSAC